MGALTLFKQITVFQYIEGITISGGEPVLQINPLVEFLKLVRGKSQLSVVLFSGLTIDEIRHKIAGPELLVLLDILIDGPFVREKKIGNSLRGSLNQSICFLSKRYSPDDINMDADTEIIIRPEGEIVITGFNDVGL